MTTAEPGPAAGPTTLTARSPEDLLAIVPVVLGFVPRDSVVMLTFGASRTFHARVDLPTGAAEVPDVVTALLGPARLHRVPRVVFVVYSGSAAVARDVGRALARAFQRAGIEVLEVLRADGLRWFSAVGRRRGVPDWGVPYDVLAHPFTAQAVLEGRVTHRSREELAASLDGVADAVARVAAAVARRGDRSGPPGQAVAESAWVRQLLRRHVAAGTVPGDDDLARLLVALRHSSVQAVARASMTRDSAPAHVNLWTEVVRRAPAGLVGAPAAVLGLAAWLAGHGALAWCALDRCRSAEPDNLLAQQVADALVNAVPPSTRAGTDALGDPA
jgi:uncharacterized protein DUF4192